MKGQHIGKAPIIIAGLYIYMEFFTIVLPFAASRLGGWLPDNVSEWLDSNYLIMGISILIIPTILLLVMGIAYAVYGIKKSGEISDDEGISLIRTQMIMRVVQIPCYVAVFVAAVICILTIFTIRFTLLLGVGDCISIVITGMVSIPVYAILKQSGRISRRRMLIYSILSFVFCADLIVTAVCYNTVVKGNKISKESYDMDRMRPVIKCSICTGEQVAGFLDKETGKFEDVMLIMNEKDLEKFVSTYDIKEKIEKIY